MRPKWIIALGLIGLIGFAAAIWRPAWVKADGPPNIPHSIEGQSLCTGCHLVGGSGVGVPGGTGIPEDHRGRPNSSCTGCHSPASQSSPSGGAAGPASGPPNIPHPLEGRSACTSCHQAGGPGAGAPGGTGMPVNHQGRTDATCTACHQSALIQSASTPAPTASPSSGATSEPTRGPAGGTPAAGPVGGAGVSAPPAKAADPQEAAAQSASSDASGLPNTGEREDRLTMVGMLLVGSAGLGLIGYSLRKLLSTSN